MVLRGQTGKIGYSEETRQKVLAIAKQMNYGIYSK
jgi:DNA-binding LacI/PurR family transcriptional regulator